MPRVSLELAARRLAEGGLVAFPTETVYGLGARADSDAAVAAIFAGKGRPAVHPLIVHLAHAGDAQAFALEPGAAFETLARAFWPGPLTMIVKRKPGVAVAASGGQATIGLRVPSHPMALELLRACRLLGVPGVAAPSANRFGRISPTTAAHVAAEFGDAVPVLDGGACAVGIESTIIDVSGPHPALLRPGQIDRQAIEAVLGQGLAQRSVNSPRASGTLEAHYAPSTPLHLATAGQLQVVLRNALAAPPGRAAPGLAVYSRTVAAPGDMHGLSEAGVVWRKMPDEPAAVAQELFAVLRELDASGAHQIWVESPPEGTAWEGVCDRLKRAAAAAA